MKSYGNILYDMYANVAPGSLNWSELTQNFRQHWDDLADDLMADGWEPTI